MTKTSSNASSGDISNQVLHLVSLPPLSPQWRDNAPHMTRICALLARRPSVGALIPVMLDIPPNLVRSLLDALYANGHIYPSGVLSFDDGAEALLKNKSISTPTFMCEESVGASFFAKLWQRLSDVS